MTRAKWYRSDVSSSALWLHIWREEKCPFEVLHAGESAKICECSFEWEEAKVSAVFLKFCAALKKEKFERFGGMIY